MENNQEKKTLAQWVLVICGGVCFFASIFALYFATTNFWGDETGKIWNAVFWILLSTSRLLIACANWKKSKVMSTVEIGLSGFFLGAFTIMLLNTLLK